MHAFEITCNARACNNFEFTFQLLMNLKYCIRSKGILEHLEAFLHLTVHDISVLGLLSSYRYHGVR